MMASTIRPTTLAEAWDQYEASGTTCTTMPEGPAMSDNKPLRRGVSGVCTRSICECERDGLGDQCIWLKPSAAEFECLGEPSLCANPRGCACFQAGRTDRPSTPVGWSDTDWLKHLEDIRRDQAVYHRGPLPETGWD